MAIARRECPNVSEAMIMVADMEDLGGEVFSINEDRKGVRHIWARFKSPRNKAEHIDAKFNELMNVIEKDGSFLTGRRQAKKPIKLPNRRSVKR